MYIDLYDRSDHIVFFHPFYEVVQEDRPSISLLIVLIYIFDHNCKLVHHIPQIFMALGWLLFV